MKFADTQIIMPDENEQASPIDPLTIGDLISFAEAAEISGFTEGHLRQIAIAGRLRAKKLARNWVTTRAALEKYKENRNFKNIPKKYRDRI
jgi:hypothetical protein